MIVCNVLLAASAAFNLEWNPRYDVTVPYEVEIDTNKLVRCGVAAGTGFAVRADGKRLGVTCFEGARPATVALRFRVPAGTRALTCEAGEGVLKTVDSSTVDNIFGDVGGRGATALPVTYVSPGDTGKELTYIEAPDKGEHLFTYEADLPKDLAGQPCKVEFDVKNVASVVWSGVVRVRQLDAEGRLLDDSVNDPRWTSHMRPVGRLTRYREEGHFHRRARRLRVEFGLNGNDAKLEVSRIAVRPAAVLPFPKYDDSFFDEGALVLGGANKTRFWYQTHSPGCWAEQRQIRDARDLFFPKGAGTVEAWFKPDWKAMAGDRATLFAWHQGYSAMDFRHGAGNFLGLVCNRRTHELSAMLRDAKKNTFAATNVVDIAEGVWSHVALAWQPGGEAVVYLNGKSALAVPLAGYAALDIKDEKIKNVNDEMGVEFYLGVDWKGSRDRRCFEPDPAHPYFEGAVDLLRVTEGVRYAGAFEPVRDYACDAATRAYFSFDRSFDGISGDGYGYIPGCVLAERDRIDHTLVADGKEFEYYPYANKPENDPNRIFEVVNYRTMPTEAEFKAGRVERRRSFDLRPGERVRVDCPEVVYADFTEIANIGETALACPALVNGDEIDPRSFADIRKGLSAGCKTDLEKVNRAFQYVLGASDYFANHNVDYPPFSDKPDVACYNAMTVLNGYCGFNCGPLNILTANILVMAADCPAMITGGYGHEFQEVFFDGKNHLYDMSAQRFFPAMDNETSAFLKEVGDQPGIHPREKASSDHFMRMGSRRLQMRFPDSTARIGVVVNPGETLRLWNGNNGSAADMQLYAKGPVRVPRYFPDYANGFLTFAGKPERTNPAFTNVTDDAFCYVVRSGYPIVSARYAAVTAQGAAPALEISTDGRTYRPLGSADAQGGVNLHEEICGRHAYLIRVKAPIGDVARFEAETVLHLNRRVLPGRLHGGRNDLRFKSETSGRARVTVQWRENAKELHFPEAVRSGTIPGFEVETVLLNPGEAKRVKVRGCLVHSAADASGTKHRALCTTHTDGLAAAWDGDDILLRAVPRQDGRRHYVAGLTVDDGGVMNTLTVIVSPNARLARLDKPAWLTKKGERVRFEFPMLPAGTYHVWNNERFPARFHPSKSEYAPTLGYWVKTTGGQEQGEEFVPSGTPRNGNPEYLKALYGMPGGRGNWKWDYPNDPSQSPWAGYRIRPSAFAATDHLDWEMRVDTPEGVELAATMILPADAPEEFRNELKKALFGLATRTWRIR